MKSFYVKNNIGHAKYVVCHHDGNKKHLDGSWFFDITLFKNKKKLVNFIADLQSSGYSETRNSCHPGSTILKETV